VGCEVVVFPDHTEDRKEWRREGLRVELTPSLQAGLVATPRNAGAPDSEEPIKPQPR
jgi:hypothetical protein